mgnify:CR=1 FL=1
MISREALEQILNDFSFEVAGVQTDKLTLSMARHSVTAEHFLDRLMAWASGSPTRKVWCEHMRYDKQFPSRWVYLTTLHAADLGAFCPSCGAKRPQEPSHV